MLQTQINKLESAVSFVSLAMQSEDFEPTRRDYAFLVDTVVDCLDKIIRVVGRDEKTDEPTDDNG